MLQKIALLVFLGILYTSLEVEAQSPCAWNTAYVCDDELDTDSVCMVIFNESNPNNGTVDPKCTNMTYASTAQQCAYTCGACCTTPAYNCQNAPAPNPINCAGLTRAQCEDPKSQSVLAQYCPSTCGLCQQGSCTDLIDCTGMSGACFDPNTQAFMYANCAKTCGCVGQTTAAPGGGGVSCADNNTNCATWNKNGFCASTYYTQAQKAQYCPSTCNLCSYGK